MIRRVLSCICACVLVQAGLVSADEAGLAPVNLGNMLDNSYGLKRIAYYGNPLFLGPLNKLYEYRQKTGELVRVAEDTYRSGPEQVIQLPKSYECTSYEKLRIVGFAVTPQNTIWLRTTCLIDPGAGRQYQASHRAVLISQQGEIQYQQRWISEYDAQYLLQDGEATNTSFEGSIKVQQIMAHPDGGYYFLGMVYDYWAGDAYILRRYGPSGELIWGKKLKAKDDYANMIATAPGSAPGVIVYTGHRFASPFVIGIHRWSEGGQLLENRSLSLGTDRNTHKLSINEHGIARVAEISTGQYRLERYTPMGSLIYQKPIAKPFAVQYQEQEHGRALHWNVRPLLPGIDGSTLLGYSEVYKDKSVNQQIVDAKIQVYARDTESPAQRSLVSVFPRGQCGYIGITDSYGDALGGAQPSGWINRVDPVTGNFMLGLNGYIAYDCNPPSETLPNKAKTVSISRNLRQVY